MADDRAYSFIADFSSRYTEGKYVFTSADLCDKVINLRLVAGSESGDGKGTYVAKDEFIIRSDFEMYDPTYLESVVQKDKPKRDVIVRKCRQKPAIKVQYRQVAQGTAIELDIFISNFFVFNKEGKTLMQFSSAYPLVKTEIQMGYFGQFAEPYKNSGGVPSISEFLEMKAPPTVQVIKCNVEYVQTDKLPPDSTLHIHGFVANSYGASVETIKTRVIGFKPPVTEDPKAMNNLPHWLYNFVTRRFLRDCCISESEKINTNNGFMESASADRLGIHVYVSQGIVNNEALAMTTVLDKKTKKEKQVKFYWQASYSDSVVKTLNNLKTLVGSAYSFKMLNNGDYLLYTKAETKNSGALKDLMWFIYDNRLAQSKETQFQANAGETIKTSKADILGLKNVTWSELMKSTGSAESNSTWAKSGYVTDNILPAVYNITTDALCTIVAPFFSFINSFDTVKFKCRYALGGLVSYYANFTASEDEFCILFQNVSFATVEDINECSMIATGKKSEAKK